VIHGDGQISDLPLGDEVYVGLFLCSHNPDVVEKVIFRDVRIVRPAKDGFVPYRDYIGSLLEILDLETGHRRVVHGSAQPFEAPNWTKDGRALIYNTSGRSEGRGRLYRFDLATRRPSLIDTGTHTRNNNDHVLSPPTGSTNGSRGLRSRPPAACPKANRSARRVRAG
jgi:hypothetical protein